MRVLCSFAVFTRLNEVARLDADSGPKQFVVKCVQKYGGQEQVMAKNDMGSICSCV